MGAKQRNEITLQNIACGVPVCVVHMENRTWIDPRNMCVCVYDEV